MYLMHPISTWFHSWKQINVCSLPFWLQTWPINYSSLSPSSSSPRRVESENLLFVTLEVKHRSLGVGLFVSWSQGLWEALRSSSWRRPSRSPDVHLITDALPLEGPEIPSCSAVELKSEQGVGEQGWCLVFKSQDERQENFWMIKPSLMVVKLALRTFLFFFYVVWKFSEREKEPEYSIPNALLLFWEEYAYLSKLQEIAKDREAWRVTVHGVTNSWTRLGDLTHIHTHFTFSFILFIWNRHKLPTSMTFFHLLEKEKQNPPCH